MAGSAMVMPAFAGDAPPESAPFVELRYRYSNLNSGSAPLRGHANTTRLQLGYLWNIGDGWSAYGEATRTRSLFGRQYDDGSGRRTPYPAEADPASTGLSNAWIGYRAEQIGLRVGQQYVRLDNGRFFSNNPWRQNPQSYDGINMTWEPSKGTVFNYYWLERVNRTVGADFPDRNQRRWELNAHLVHLDQALPLGKLAAYGYFVRNDTLPNNSVRTIGARWTGSQQLGAAALGWTAEVARQYNYENNPARFNLGYHLFEATYGYSQLSIRTGDERLGGDGTTPFNVAYGAVRAFNGWVVAFRIPRSGLHERYVGILGSVPGGYKINWQVTYRQFTPVQDGSRLGGELDAGVRVMPSENFSIEMQYGDYRAQDHGVDERKVWLIAQYRFGQPPA
jgi:hypothetical protein